MKVAAAHCNPKIKPALAHNDRTDSRSPNITPELTHLNEYTASAKEVRANIDKLYKQAEKNYYAYCEKKNGLAKSGKPKGLQNFTKKEKCHHEFIFEIAESTTMQQCQELADKIAELTGFKPLQLAIHRDEVFQDSKGKETHHYHAHAVFFTLDDNGLQLARREASLNKANLSKIQTLASECLKMPRGEQRYLSGKPQPAYIQDYKIYKAIKEQNKRDFAIIDAKERQLNEKTQEISKIFKDKEKEILDKEKKITSKSNELKNLEYDLNEQKRTLNQSFEKTLTELHLKQE
ncbi:mobilization protein, partial [Helicobacter sp. MIT 99-10781]